MKTKTVLVAALSFVTLTAFDCGGGGNCAKAQADCDKCPVTAQVGHLDKATCTEVIAEYKKQGDTVAELSCSSYITTLETDCK